jgi:hypothetical protein
MREQHKWSCDPPVKPGAYWLANSENKIKPVTISKQLGMLYVAKGKFKVILDYFLQKNKGILWCEADIPPLPKDTGLGPLPDPLPCPICGDMPKYASSAHNGDFKHLICYREKSHEIRTQSYRQAGNNDFYRDIISEWNRIVFPKNAWTQEKPKKEGLYWLFIPDEDSLPLMVYFEKSHNQVIINTSEKLPALLKGKGLRFSLDADMFKDKYLFWLPITTPQIPTNVGEDHERG